MHPVNRILALLGLELQRKTELSSDFLARYESQLSQLTEHANGTRIIRAPADESGNHPRGFEDFECTFAARQIQRFEPAQVLDVGSYRLFILGMLAQRTVTTIDVRSRPPSSGNETVITCDAKEVALADDSFDAVISLCAIEHFGLGRYGDAFDPEADKKAFREWVRVLKPGGHLILSTTITRHQPQIAFNQHRIYTLSQLRTFCEELVCIEEQFFSHGLHRICGHEETTEAEGGWDVYMGCWEKPMPPG